MGSFWGDSSTLWVGDVFAARPGQHVNSGITNDAGLALIIYTSPSLHLVFTVYFLPWELAGAKYKLQKAGGAAAARKIKAGVRGEGGNSGQGLCGGEMFIRRAVLVAGEGWLLAPKPPEKACCLAVSVLTRVPHLKRVFTEVGARCGVDTPEGQVLELRGGYEHPWQPHPKGHRLLKRGCGTVRSRFWPFGLD